jgi:hypothetical protein
MGIFVVHELVGSSGTRTGAIKRITFPLGRIGAPWRVIRRQTVLFRQAVEDAVAELNGGSIDLRQAKLIRTACTAFESAQRIRRVLAMSGEPGQGLDHAQWLALDTALQNREAACDKALLTLGLDQPAPVYDVGGLPPAAIAAQQRAMRLADAALAARQAAEAEKRAASQPAKPDAPQATTPGGPKP